VGFVFQEYALFPHLTALGNVITALGHRPRAERRPRAMQLLHQVHLSQQARRRPGELSGGERQRVALARALAREPAALLLDEPFAAVDRRVRRHLQDEVDALRRTLDIPIVLVTHDFEDVVRLSTHLAILEQGRVVANGPLESLMSRPDLTWLREAVGLGSVFDAVVTRAFPDRRLVELAFDGGTLLSSDDLAVGARLRIRIPAREVILARAEPDRLSVHNALAGTVSALHMDAGVDRVMVQVAVGGILLLAEVTRDAIHNLAIALGTPIYALVKSISIDVVGAQEGGNR
jgi:molybdate transport system ATP-binding protein